MTKDVGSAVGETVRSSRASVRGLTSGGALTMWHTHAGTTTMCHPAVDPGCPQHTGRVPHVFTFAGAHDPFPEDTFAAGGRAAFTRRDA